MDIGNVVDILSKSAFQRMGLSKDILSRVNFPLFGFSGSYVIPLEKINLHVTLGERPHQRTQIIEFFVV